VILVDASGLAVRRPDRPLFEGLSLTVSDGDRVGVVGINGCGKSTLLRILAGAAEPEEGTVRFGQGVRIGFLAQQPELPPGTVREAVGQGWQGEAALDRLGMTPAIDLRVDQLSGGQAKRVALARLLAGEHDLLILDEPTNHLDLDAVEWLEDRLAQHRGGLLLVTHDRHVLDRLTTEVLELDRGTAYRHVAKGEHAGSGYAAFLEARAARAEQEAQAEQKRRNLARAELAWLRRGAPARTRKSGARVQAATELVNQRAPRAARTGELDLGRTGSARLGSKVVELHDVSFAYPGGRDVLRHLTHTLEPGERLGLVGANGSGKSTLLGLVAGRLAPTGGRVERGTTVQVGWFDQQGQDLDLTQRVRDAVAGPNRAPDLEQAKLMERFWFDSDAQWAPIATLSGGERRRLQLLLVLTARPNVLLLDEPTNDLDLDTLRALEDFLDGWEGAAIVASHDRTFLDRTVEEVLALDGKGGASLVRGGYAGWRAEHDRRRAEEAAARRAESRSTAAPAATAAPAKPSKGRSPSTLRRLLGEAEKAVAQAVGHRDALLARLAEVGSDHVALAEVGEQLADAEHALADAEERWLTLAAEAEAAGLSL